MSLDASKPRMGARWRAVLIGLLLIPLNSFWIMQMEAVYYSAHSTVYGLFFNAICNLLVPCYTRIDGQTRRVLETLRVWLTPQNKSNKALVLIGLNAPLKKFSPGLAFSQGELLTVYIMLNLSSALVGHSTMQLLPPTMAAPFGLATPENEWGELFGRYIPRWLAISDERALDGYITGLKSESTLYTARYIEAWLGPVLIWSLFICVLMFVMFCINIILRKQWTDRERLTFPIAQLPYEMTDPVSGVFKYKLFWVSFIIVGGVNIINGFHFFFPDVPYLRVRPYNLGAFFTTKPWDALGYAPLTFRPFLIGLIFLIPLDMIFSSWFFFFFWKAQLILGSALGLRQRPEFPEQSAGAYIALCVIALWMGKGHLARIFRAVFHFAAGENRDGGDTEPLQYRVAVLGLIFGIKH